MPEPVLRCPGCGAPSAADAAACEYCGSALATVTCPSCFAPTFNGSRFCSRCGAETRRETVADDTPLPCPRCREPMDALRLGPTTARECATCGGLWLDPASLQRLCDAREERASIVSMLAARVPATKATSDPIRYVPCPRCGKLMNRVNFAHSSGVILDVCKTDGVWLDRGELERVVGFVEAGGLTVARDCERERFAEEQRRLIALQGGHGDRPARADTSAMSFSMSNWSDAGSASTIERLLLDALGLVLK
jgi:Zn-finger nucleic acid-binding protein